VGALTPQEVAFILDGQEGVVAVFHAPGSRVFVQLREDSLRLQAGMGALLRAAAPHDEIEVEFFHVQRPPFLRDAAPVHLTDVERFTAAQMLASRRERRPL
jgi:hypothetical protein